LGRYSDRSGHEVWRPDPSQRGQRGDVSSTPRGAARRDAPQPGLVALRAVARGAARPGAGRIARRGPAPHDAHVGEALAVKVRRGGAAAGGLLRAARGGPGDGEAQRDPRPRGDDGQVQGHAGRARRAQRDGRRERGPDQVDRVGAPERRGGLGDAVDRRRPRPRRADEGARGALPALEEARRADRARPEQQGHCDDRPCPPARGGSQASAMAPQRRG